MYGSKNSTLVNKISFVKMQRCIRIFDDGIIFNEHAFLAGTRSNLLVVLRKKKKVTINNDLKSTYLTTPL